MALNTAPAASSSAPKAAAAARDPFQLLKDSVTDLMKGLMNDFDKWKDALARTNTASNKNFALLVDKVEATIVKVESSLKQGQKIVDTSLSVFAISLSVPV